MELGRWKEQHARQHCICICMSMLSVQTPDSSSSQAARLRTTTVSRWGEGEPWKQQLPPTALQGLVFCPEVDDELASAGSWKVKRSMRPAHLENG